MIRIVGMVAFLAAVPCYGQLGWMNPGTLAEKLASPEPASYGQWVVMPVVVNIAGNSFDALSSWKQPESNKFLMEKSGPYQNKFYRNSLQKKALMVGSVAAISLAVGYKWPRTRRFLGLLNGSFGVTFTGVAISNIVRNPYYR